MASAKFHAAECEALAALYDSTKGSGWASQDGWLVTDTPCTWHGVTCQAGHVQRLELTSNRLMGPIPPQLGNLASLQRLDLHASVDRFPYGSCINQLSGAIPSELGNLTNLTGPSIRTSNTD